MPTLVTPDGKPSVLLREHPRHCLSRRCERTLAVRDERRPRRGAAAAAAGTRYSSSDFQYSNFHRTPTFSIQLPASPFPRGSRLCPLSRTAAQLGERHTCGCAHLQPRRSARTGTPLGTRGHMAMDTAPISASKAVAPSVARTPRAARAPLALHPLGLAGDLQPVAGQPWAPPRVPPLARAPRSARPRGRPAWAGASTAPGPRSWRSARGGARPHGRRSRSQSRAASPCSSRLEAAPSVAWHRAAQPAQESVADGRRCPAARCRRPRRPAARAGCLGRPPARCGLPAGAPRRAH
eukprot:scaffold91004_cov66-Phaeocystis_antarctica.AAC.2